MLRFEKLKRDHLTLVLQWRMRPHVADVMFTEVKDNMENQIDWFNLISKDQTKVYWIVLFGDIPIGLVNLSEIDETNSRCNAGFYIGEVEYLNLGGLIPIYLYNHVFTNLKLNKIFGEVVSSNEGILRLHQFHGFRKVGTLKEHIIKHEQKVDVVVVELLASEWSKLSRFSHQTAIFP